MKELIIDPTIIFMSIEEAKLLGADLINFILDLGRDIVYSAISFKYIMSLEELIPIAIIIQPADNTLKNIPLSTISRLLSSVGGYIYGSNDSIGILIPIESETELYNRVVEVVPQIIKQLLGIDVKPIIINYSIETV